jgi:hypothetical protein
VKVAYLAKKESLLCSITLLGDFILRGYSASYTDVASFGPTIHPSLSVPCGQIVSGGGRGDGHSAGLENCKVCIGLKGQPEKK